MKNHKLSKEYIAFNNNKGMAVIFLLGLLTLLSLPFNAVLLLFILMGFKPLAFVFLLPVFFINYSISQSLTKAFENYIHKFVNSKTGPDINVWQDNDDDDCQQQIDTLYRTVLLPAKIKK